MNFFILNLPSHREKEGNTDSGTERVITEYKHLDTVMNTRGTWNAKKNQITGNKSSKSQFWKRSQVGNKRDEKAYVRTAFVAFQIYPISLSGSNTRQERGLSTMKTELTFKRRIKSHLPFVGIIRSSPYSPRFQDNG